MPVLGAVTIGQAPRHDLTGELADLLGPGVEILERGALDDLDPAAVAALAPAPGEEVLVTRLGDGTAVRVGRTRLLPRIEDALQVLAPRADLVLLLCTGSFPRFACPRPVLYPARVLQAIVATMGPRRIGVLTPAPEQCAAQRARWSELVPDVIVEPASPYGDPGSVAAAAAALARASVELVVLDCIGYTRALKMLVRARVGVPVVEALSACARVAAELLG